MKRNKYLLLNYIFIICLIILFLNDHFFKHEFCNWFTGKLSDIVGIIILPLLLNYIFPRLKNHSLWISALLFTFWKSSYSENLINFYNQFAFIQITRIVDYSDLFVLIFLPIPYLVIQKVEVWNYIKIKNVEPLFVLMPTLFILISTAPPASFYYTYSNGTFRCYKCNLSVHYSQNEIVEKLQKSNIVFDTILPIGNFALNRVPGFADENIHFYKINEMIIDKDTLRNLDFSMRSSKSDKTTIYFNGMDVNSKIPRYEMDRKIKKYYKSLVLKQISGSLKK